MRKVQRLSVCHGVGISDPEAGDPYCKSEGEDIVWPTVKVVAGAVTHRLCVTSIRDKMYSAEIHYMRV